jgi:hypothetical protein
MDPKMFAELERKVFEAIPAEGGRSLSSVVGAVATDDSGYGRSDAKAAVLGLKASGKVQLDEDGTVRRK